MKKIRELKKYLKQLTEVVDKVIDALDGEMNMSSSADRGKRIARLINRLELANDNAKHFGLKTPIEKC